MNQLQAFIFVIALPITYGSNPHHQQKAKAQISSTASNGSVRIGRTGRCGLSRTMRDVRDAVGGSVRILRTARYGLSRTMRDVHVARHGAYHAHDGRGRSGALRGTRTAFCDMDCRAQCATYAARTCAFCARGGVDCRAQCATCVWRACVWRAKNPPCLRTRDCLFEVWRCPTLTWGDPTLPSALVCFTSGFGMEPGGAIPLWPPDINCHNMDSADCFATLLFRFDKASYVLNKQTPWVLYG